MQLSDEVWRHAPWSYSKANVAHTCAFAFHKRYVQKEKPKVPEARETTVGIVVHKILEWTDMGMTVDEAFAKASECYELTYDVELEVQTFRGAVTDWVRGLARFCDQFQVHKKIPEKNIAIDGEFQLTGYNAKNGLVRGKIDLTLFTGNKRAVVIDHKSGVVKRIEYHQQQLELYCIMADAMAKGLKGVRAALHFVGADKNVKGTRTSWLPEYNVEVVRTQFRERLVKFLEGAASVAELADPQPTECWLCNFCGYQPVCPMKT